MVIHKKQFCKVDNPILSTFAVDNPHFLYTGCIYNRIFRQRGTKFAFSCNCREKC